MKMTSLSPKSNTRIDSDLTIPIPDPLKFTLIAAEQQGNNGTKSSLNQIKITREELVEISEDHIFYVISDDNKGALASLMKTLDHDMRGNLFHNDIKPSTVGIVNRRPEVLLLKYNKDDQTFEEELAAIRTYIFELFENANPPPSISHMISFLKDRNTFIKFRKFILSHTALWPIPKIVGTYYQICAAYKREPAIRGDLMLCASLKNEANWFVDVEKKISDLEKSISFKHHDTTESEWHTVIQHFKELLRRGRCHHDSRKEVYNYFNTSIGVMFYIRDVFAHFSEHIIQPEIRSRQMIVLIEYLVPNHLTNFAFRLYGCNIELYHRFFPKS